MAGSSGGLVNRTLDHIWRFVEDRVGIELPMRKVPPFSLKVSYWIGSLLLFGFLYQAVSGILLAMYYVPTPQEAYASTQAMLTQVPLGQLVLTTHLYMAYAIIFLVLVHLFRNYFYGAYRAPRELTWIAGVFLLAITLGYGFTGYLLPYSQLSVDATDVGTGVVGSVPIVGPWLVQIMTGNGTPENELTRFFAFHVFYLGGLLVAFVGVHFYLFEKHGVAPPPTSDPKEKRRYSLSSAPFGRRRQSPDDPHAAERFAPEDERDFLDPYPTLVRFVSELGFGMIALVFLGAFLFPTSLPPAVGSSAATGVIRPEWYFLAVFKLLDIEGVTPALGITLVVLAGVYLVALPFIDRYKASHPRSRPAITTVGLVGLAWFIFLTAWGYLTPGVEIPTAEAVAYLGAIAAAILAIVYAADRRYLRAHPGARAARRGLRG